MAIQVTTSTNGTYTFAADSTLDTYGCLYRDPFDPMQPTFNMISCNDDSDSSANFQLSTTLTANQSVVLVVTTYSTSQIGSFKIEVYGPVQVTFAGMLSFCGWENFRSTEISMSSVQSKDK